MGIDTDAQLWREDGAEIIRLAHYGRELQRDIMGVRGTFIESALNYDWTNVLHIFNTTGQRFWRFLSSDYRSAKKPTKACAELKSLTR